MSKDKLFFGKYEGKTFDYIYRVDKQYCSWFLHNCKRGKNFKEYIIKRGLFNPDSIRGKSTSASNLAKKISMDPDIIKFVKEIVEFQDEEEEDEEDTLSLLGEKCEVFSESLDDFLMGEDSVKASKSAPFASSKRNISPQVFGQFVDYYIRYRISYGLMIPFKDNRVDAVLKRKDERFHTIEKAYEFLTVITSDKDSEWDPEDCCEITAYETRVQQSVLHCSVAHSVAFGGGAEDLKYLSKKLLLHPIILKSVDKFIEDNIFEAKEVRLNPSVSYKKIGGDADLIFDNTLVDFKTGKVDTCYYISQLFIYAILFEKRTGIDINNIVIFNPCEESVTNFSISTEQKKWFEEYLLKLKLI